MLWDLASRHARLPLYILWGGCLERVPDYRNTGGSTIDELVADAVQAQQEGFQGCKDHSYRGIKGNIEMARELRAALGDEMILQPHDQIEAVTGEAPRAQAEGFPAYKDAYAESVRGAVELTGRVREAVGPDLYLMHNGRQRYDPAEALRLGRILQEQDHHWFEDPHAI